MYLSRYQLKAEEQLTRFEFIIEGQRGAVRKLIEFQRTLDTTQVFVTFINENNPTHYWKKMEWCYHWRLFKRATEPDSLPEKTGAGKQSFEDGNASAE